MEGQAKGFTCLIQSEQGTFSKEFRLKKKKKRQNNLVLKDTDSGVKVPAGPPTSNGTRTSWPSSPSLGVRTGAMGSITPH